MRRPNWRNCAFASVLVLILAFVGEANVAGASGTTQKPSLTISAPASVANEAPWSASASGYSGQYNTVTTSQEKGTVGCPKNPETAFNKKTQHIAKDHKYKIKFSFLQIVEEPQIRTLCVFLYKAGSPHKYILKTTHYQIS